MTIACKHCGSTNTKPNGNYKYSNGVDGKRVQCRDCGRRSTVPINGEAPKYFYHFDDKTLMRILRPTVSLAVLAKELGCTKGLLEQICWGKIYTHRMPDVKRLGNNPPPVVIPDGPSCWHCSEWRETRCAMGFPDPDVEGPRFAADCALYPERRCG